MSKKSPAHSGPHKYRKVLWGRRKTVVWKCIMKNCPHYLHNEFILGKKSLCNKCGKEFIMNPDKMRRVRPKCDLCQHKGDPIFKQLEDLLEGL